MKVFSQVAIVTDAECEAKMNLTIAGSMLCAGGEGRGACEVRASMLVEMF